MNKLVGAIVVSSLLLGACSNEVAKPTKQESPPSTTEESFDTSEYLDDMSEVMTNVSDSLGLVIDQASKLPDNPHLMRDEEWMQDTAVALVTLDASIQLARSVDEPPDPELQEAHIIVMQAMDHYQFVADNYATAIDDLDSGLLQECTTHIGLASDYIVEATDILTAYAK